MTKLKSTETPEDGVFVKVGEDQMTFSEDTDGNIDLAIQFLQQRKDADNED